MMNCELLQEDLCAYTDNELEPSARANVESHIGACEACAEEVRATRSVRALVGRLRLLDEDPPASVTVTPDLPESAPSPIPVAWWNRPIPARTIAVAAAAVLVALVVSYRHYESRFMQQTQMRDAVVAHLRAVADAAPDPQLLTQRVAFRPTDVGHRVALQRLHPVGPHLVSELRFPSGAFNDARLTRFSVAGREYRAGQIGDFSVATCRRGPHQVVLVAACSSPKALLMLAQNIPLDRPVTMDGAAY